MYVLNYKERKESEVPLPGVTKTTMRWLIGKHTGAKTYFMRHFEMQPGGIIPLHSHREEHEIFVLTGEAKVLGDCDTDVVKKDDVVFIPSDFPHGYDNTTGTEVFSFICVIPLREKE
ncbi:MAG: cupin domain-containing protein [Candidatus Thorarchaeota archaeon]|jgi:quercetin dioxygenase-like cupin family protein